MPSYRIHRMKENARQQFRWAPHAIGDSVLKQRDYEETECVEAANPYAVWTELKNTEAALHVGDILESDAGDLRIYKYVGFEQAQWQLPEVKTGLEPVDTVTSAPQ